MKWRLQMAGEARHSEEEYFGRLEFELGIIDNMGFPAIFDRFGLYQMGEGSEYLGWAVGQLRCGFRCGMGAEDHRS